MKITITRPDNSITVDGVFHKVNCSDMHGLVQTVQWDGDAPDTGEGWQDRGSGHIEFFNDHKGAFLSNLDIASLRQFTFLVERWQEAHAAAQAMEQADKQSRADGDKALAHLRGA